MTTVLRCTRPEVIASWLALIEQIAVIVLHGLVEFKAQS